MPIPRWIWRRIITLLAAVVIFTFITACGAPGPGVNDTPTPQASPGATYTAAVQTVMALLTEQAAQPTRPLDTPAAVTPTLTLTLPPSSTPAPELTATPTATQAPSPTSTNSPDDPRQALGEPTWQESFETSQNWAFVEDDHTRMEITDGQMVLTAFEPEAWDGWAVTWPKAADFYAEITAETGPCSGLDRYGLLVRAKDDASEAYLFGFSCDGRYSFRQWDGERFQVHVDWTASPHISSGPGQTNRLGVRAEGNTISLFANGMLLTEVKDDAYEEGHFGLFIGSASTPDFIVNVDELTYWELSE